MANFSNGNRRDSTTMRYERIRSEYEKVIGELGNYARLVPKSYIYEQTSQRTGLSVRTIVRAISGK